MGASRDPHLALLKKAFAASHSCDERTARRHFNKNSEEWQAFIAKQGREAAANLAAAQPSAPSLAVALQVLGPASPAEIQKPPVADQPDDQLTEPERILKTQWRIYKQASTAWHNAIVDADELKALALGQATIKAQDAYYKAKSRYDQWELDERRKIPVDEYKAFHANFIVPLVNLMRNLPAQLSALICPTDPGRATQLGNEYMISTVNPQLKRMIDDFEGKVPIPVAA